MEIEVHDVGHGFCASLVHDNGNVMLWDCGHSEQNRPSQFLRARRISTVHRFFVTNYDEDHLSDLPALRDNLELSILHRNKSVSADQLQALKLRPGRPITNAMDSMLDMIRTYTAGVPEPPPEFPGVIFNTYSNSYGSDFNDTNNISLVTFLECGPHKLIIPGDLEGPGWRTLLRRADFRNELAGVTVFIAPHHGRESGYCPEVFDLCHPRVVVFSDSAIKHASQEMSSTYGKHASGTTFIGQTRYVLSTRNDGPIRWTTG